MDSMLPLPLLIWANATPSEIGSMSNDSFLQDGTSEANNFIQNGRLEGAILTIREILTYVIALITLFAMGASVTTTDLKKHIVRPVGVGIGMACQFLLMPFAAFIIIKIFGIQGAYGTGVLLISCCPGGTISNVFTYFADGDISLSVAMTTLSCLAALVAMPGNLWLYGHFVDLGQMVIPYGMISLSMALTVPPAIFGFLLSLKKPKWAPLVTKVGSSIGLALIGFVMTLFILDKPDIFTDAPWQLYVSVVLLPPVGLSSAYLLAWLCKRTPAVRRTVAIEASIQNVGLALAVANLSFTPDIVRPVVVYPSMYCVTMMLTGLCVAVLYRVKKHFSHDERHSHDQPHVNYIPAPMSHCQIEMTRTSTLIS